MQKRVNDCQSEALLARLALDWDLGPWISEGFYPFLGKSGSLCLNCLCKRCGLCFPSVSLEFCFIPGRGCWHDQFLIKALGPQVSNGQHFTSVVKLMALGIKCATPVGDDSGKLAPGFLWTLWPHQLFPLLVLLCLYPFALISHSSEFNCLLSPGILLVNHQIWAWSRGPLKH